MACPAQLQHNRAATKDCTRRLLHAGGFYENISLDPSCTFPIERCDRPCCYPTLCNANALVLLPCQMTRNSHIHQSCDLHGSQKHKRQLSPLRRFELFTQPKVIITGSS